MLPLSLTLSLTFMHAAMTHVFTLFSLILAAFSPVALHYISFASALLLLLSF
jgi:hypothetical protein